MLGAVALVLVSAKGTSLTVLGVAIGIFVVFSAAFVLRQLVFGHGQPVVVAWLGGVLVGVGLLSSGIYASTAFDPLLIVSAALLVLGMGWLVEWVRRQPRRHWVLGTLIGSSVSSVGSLVGLVLLLRHARQTVFGGWELVLGGLAAISLVVALNMASELALRRTSPDRSGRVLSAGRRRWLLLAAIVPLAGAIAFAVSLYFADLAMVSVLIVAVLLLLLAMVSDTHADVALLLVALTVMGAAPNEVPSPVPNFGPQADVLVALGDSYMSGEGADQYFTGTDDARGDECRRSPTAYAVRASQEQKAFNQLVFLACSGAVTANIISDPQEEAGTQKSQLADLLQRSSGLRPKLVIVSVGGNDAGFASLGEACVAPGDCTSLQKYFLGSNLKNVQAALITTYLSLRQILPNTPILAVPYPQPLAAAATCKGVPLNASERSFIRDFVDQLDATVGSAAEQADIWFMPSMEDALAQKHLQLCANRKSQAGINFLSFKSTNGVSSQRYNPARWVHNSFHPNARGHAAMLSALDEWLKDHPEVFDSPGPVAQAQGVPAAPVASAVTQPAPECGVTDATQARCRPELRAFELNQIVGLLPSILLVLVALVLIWGACIAAVTLLPRPRDAGATARYQGPGPGTDDVPREK